VCWCGCPDVVDVDSLPGLRPKVRPVELLLEVGAIPPAVPVLLSSYQRPADLWPVEPSDPVSVEDPARRAHANASGERAHAPDTAPPIFRKSRRVRRRTNREPIRVLSSASQSASPPPRNRGVGTMPPGFFDSTRYYGASSASWHPSSEQLFSASSLAFRSSRREGSALSYMLSSS
jgi:hypothetical protein